jgi:RNA 2',3'-cyclic 3'-phosphodiesterase
MHRLFTAFRPCPEVREQLLSIMEGVSGARWQDDDQLHLTTRFIGEVDRRTAEDVAASLVSIRFRPVSIALNGVGTFAKRDRVHTLWAGISPHDELSQIHKKVDQALVRLGLPPEPRAFMPHITLARFGRDVEGLDHFLARHAGLASPSFMLDWMGLYESHLGQGGAHYELVARVPAA